MKTKIKSFVDKFKFLFDAPINNYNSVIINLLGIQVIRVLTHNFVHFIKNYPKKLDLDNDLVKKFKNDGIISIENFLPEKDFKKIKEIFDEKLEKLGKLEVNKTSGISWHTLIFDGNVDDENLKYVYNLFAQNSQINQFIMSAIKKDVDLKPAIGFQKLFNPYDNTDDKDYQNVIHSDRFFPCIKINLNVDNNDETNGAYWYSIGSHKLNIQRIVHEFVFSICNSFLEKKLKITKYIENNRCKPNPKILPKIYENFKQIINPENTLIVSNNMGFHSKGSMRPGTYRRQIRIVYYYLQRPFYFNYSKKIYNFFFK